VAAITTPVAEAVVAWHEGAALTKVDGKRRVRRAIVAIGIPAAGAVMGMPVV
jgi:hypothetical protein